MISPSERYAQQVADAIARNIYAASPRSARHTVASPTPKLAARPVIVSPIA
jgi:hypothetical protein